MKQLSKILIQIVVLAVACLITYLVVVNKQSDEKIMDLINSEKRLKRSHQAEKDSIIKNSNITIDILRNSQNKRTVKMETTKKRVEHEKNIIDAANTRHKRDSIWSANGF